MVSISNRPLFLYSPGPYRVVSRTSKYSYQDYFPGCSTSLKLDGKNPGLLRTLNEAWEL